MRLLLRGGRIIDPSQRLDDQMDLLIEGRTIVGLGKNLIGTEGESDLTTLELEGKLVVPGLIDMHTHLREPGFE